MTRRLATILVALLVLVGASCSDPDNSDTINTGVGETTTTEVAQTTSPTTDTTLPVEAGDHVVEADMTQIPGLVEGPIHEGDLLFQEEAADAMAAAPEERGAAAHSAETLRTPEELTTWLKGSDPKATPVRQRVEMTIAATCGVEEVATHLDDSQGWLLMVVVPQSQIQGTSYWVDGQMRFAEDWREVGENDAYWIPVCTNGPDEGDLVLEGVVRADCGNGSDKPRIRIVRPDTPAAPPVDIPPGEEYVCPPRLPFGEWPVCKDTPSQDPSQQGNTPPGGAGPEEGGSVEGGPLPPAGTPPATHENPPPPTAPPTTVAGPPVTSPPTTSPPATTPPTTSPPTTEISPPR